MKRKTVKIKSQDGQIFSNQNNSLTTKKIYLSKSENANSKCRKFMSTVTTI